MKKYKKAYNKKYKKPFKALTPKQKAIRELASIKSQRGPMYRVWPFGSKYKGTPLKQLPTDYILQVYNDCKCSIGSWPLHYAIRELKIRNIDYA